MTLRLLLLAALTLTVFSCQKNDQDLLHEAQSCLNTAPASEARNCVSELASMSSPQANRLKCSAVFISEGYREASDFINAMDKLKDDGEGCANCSGTLNAMNALNFSQGDNTQADARDRNIAVANEAFNVCSNANSKGYTQISSLFKLGTTTSMWAYEFTGVAGASPTPAELEAALASMIADPEAAETVGEVAIVAHQSVCQGTESPSESTVKFCEELGVALNSGGTAESIGACLLNKINDKDFVCP